MYKVAYAIESPIRSGCKEIRGSTSIHNPSTDKLFSRVARERILEGKWVRYLLDIKKFQDTTDAFLRLTCFKDQFELLLSEGAN